MPTYFGPDQLLQPKTNAFKFAIANTLSQPARQLTIGLTFTGTPLHTGRSQENLMATKLYNNNKQGGRNHLLAMTFLQGIDPADAPGQHLDYEKNARRGLEANGERALEVTRVLEQVKLDPSTNGNETK